MNWVRISSIGAGSGPHSELLIIGNEQHEHSIRGFVSQHPNQNQIKLGGIRANKTNGYSTVSRVTQFILQGALLVQDGGYMHTITPTLFPGINYLTCLQKVRYMNAYT